MSRKNTLVYPVARAQSLATTFTTAATVIRNADNCSYHVNVTTTNSIGTINVQASNDYAVNPETNLVTAAGTWANIPLSTAVGPNATSEVILIDLRQLPFNAVRINYVPGTAGTGTCDITLVTKQIGG